MDRQGIPHIAFVDADGNIIYGKLQGTTWVTEVAASDQDPGRVSIAVNNAGTVSIAYIRGSGGTLHIASKAAGSNWQVSASIATFGGLNSGARVAMTDTATHLSVTDTTNQALKHIRVSNGSTTIETVASGQISLFSSLALDSSGEPHIAYSVPGDAGELRLARRSPQGWSTEQVEANGSFDFVSLRFNGNDEPLIAYQKNGSGGACRCIVGGDLKLAKRQGGVWTRELIDTIGAGMSEHSLAIGSDNFPHIVYSAYTDSKVRYASWTGSRWVIQVLGSQNFVPGGVFNGIELDPYDHPYIAYGGVSVGGVKVVH